jgi:surface antigen
VVVGSLALPVTPAAAAHGTAPGHSHRTKAGAIGAEREPSAVFARSSYLCMGYDACREAGMANGGYASNNQKMYWRMYAGHNCTNYAAYRMVKSGLPNERPWSGGGNATYWGTSMRQITDDVPRVGAVAWWRANTGPAGSAGHVAYVEEVVSSDQIVISQDSWGGDFSWAVVTRSSGNWPSGFVHFNDKALTNTEAPAISGIAKVGSVLSATPGGWRPATASVAYQWFADGTPVKGAVNATFRLTRARLGQQVTVRATGSQAGLGSKSATSPPTDPVQPGQLRNTAAPEITGVAQVESTLALSPGTWTPAADLTFQWLADGQPVAGATGTTLDLGPDLVNRTITATVTASREGYDPVTAAAAPTAPVAPGTFKITTAPRLLGVPELGETLTADAGVYAPADPAVVVDVQWLRDGEPVLNATGPTYQITDLDLGSRISARVTLSRAGYTATTLDTDRTPVLHSDPVMRVVTEPVNHRVTVLVTLTAPGVTEVTGTVLVRIAGVTQQVTLDGGTAKATLKHLPPGRRKFTVRYAGSPTVNGIVKTRVIRIG